MQILVQNVPFVYNPDTIYVGLGFSKGKNDWWNTVHQKVSAMLCSICYLSPAAFTWWIISKSWLHEGGSLFQMVFNQSVYTDVLPMCTVEPKWHVKEDYISWPYIIALYATSEYFSALYSNDRLLCIYKQPQ